METQSLEEISRMHHVMQTVGEMCGDRGYVVPEQWCPGRLDEFKAKYVKQPGAHVEREKMMLYCRRPVDGDSLFVFFNAEASVNLDRVKEYRSRAQSENAKTVILVVAGRLNPPTKKFVESLARSEVQPLDMQVFHEDDLVVNITKHELVPRHELLSADETKEVLQAFSLKMSMLPRILSKDPIAAYYGSKKGQVFRIQRQSETAGEYTTYRQVV